MLLASSSVFRRQKFLIRSLGGSIDFHTNCSSGKMQSVEVDAESIIRVITPALDQSRHKGQAGT
jgi:ATP-dependent NAD(P)H-hydrate dehydratase